MNSGVWRSLLCILLAVAPGATRPAQAADEPSAAERALFQSPHLAGVPLPSTLRYRFSQRGSMQAAFDDTVLLRLRPREDGGCCSADADFLSGPRRMLFPDLPDAEGNPVLLYFLERDVREMSRLTHGQANHFRRRVRLALAQSAQVRELMLPYQGRAVPAREISITPYADDPQRGRFEALANKRYVFTLSSAVPGAVLALRSQVDTLMTQELALDDTTPPEPERNRP